MRRSNRANGARLAPDELARRLGAWSTASGPLYRQLADRIGRLVADGQLRAGDGLPPERSLATELAVSRGTIVAAYDLLRSADLVERVQGSGTRVVEGGAAAVARGEGFAPDVASSLFSPIPDTIDLLKAVPPLTTVAHELLERGDLTTHPAQWASVEPAGVAPLRAAIAERYTREGLATTATEVMVTTGAQQAIGLVVDHVVERGDVVLAEHLTWPGLTDAVRRAGGRVHGVPMDRDGIDVDELRAAVERHRPALIVVNPHHHNPTGSRLSPARRRGVAEIAAAHAVPLLEDRVAARLAFDGVVPPPLAQEHPAGPSFTVDGLSKVACAGLRVGWLRSDAASVQALRSNKALADLWSPIPSQLIGLQVLEQLDRSVREAVRTLRDRHLVLQEAMARRLPDWRIDPVRGGMTMWARLPNGSAHAFARYATRHGVAVASGREFSTSMVEDDHVRLPFTQPETVLVEAVDRLAAAWESFPRGRLDEPAVHPAIV